MNILVAILGIGIIAVLYVWSLYNSLVRLAMRVKEAWSQIDVQLERKADLIPNLVETVKGYVKHEKTVLAEVTAARSALLSAHSPKEKAMADVGLAAALKSLFAVAEAYPQLKANENFLHLQKELADTEDKVAFARQYYNTIVSEYNTMLQVFPNSLFVPSWKFTPKEFFESEKKKKDVTVKFS